MVDLNKSSAPRIPLEKISYWVEEHSDLLYSFAGGIAKHVT